MAPRNFADRTVQYWRLVDARDGSEVEELDWHDIIARYIYGQRQTFVIDKRDHAGTAIAIEMEERWAPAFDVTNVAGAVGASDPSTTYGPSV